MEGKQKIEVVVKAVVIKNKRYCPFCSKKTRRSPYGEHQNVEGFVDYCTCKRALENDRLQRELEDLNQQIKKIESQIAKIPNSRKKLMLLQEKESSKEFQCQLVKIAPAISLVKDSQQSTSQPE